MNSGREVGFAFITGIYGRAQTLLMEDMDDIPVISPTGRRGGSTPTLLTAASALTSSSKRRTQLQLARAQTCCFPSELRKDPSIEDRTPALVRNRFVTKFIPENHPFEKASQYARLEQPK